ncbi:MAG: DUF3617 family protein [Sphingopyxis sp.]|nr:DUF3617 family protein [Sphingopyxis sp.]
MMIAGTASGSTATPFKPGAWDITREMKGSPRAQGPQTERYCFTEAQLQADPAAPLNVPPRPREGRQAPQCTAGPTTVTDGKASFSATCKGPMGSVKANWSGTYSATSFAMTGTMKMGFMSARMISTGRYLGACSKQ